MTDSVSGPLPAELAAADDELLRAVDAALSAGVRRAGRHVVCRRGCAACCLGPFDPVAGECLLYAARPLSCRTYGLPIHLGAVTLPACPLNFTGAAADEVRAATVAPDPEDREGALLRRAGELGLDGETVAAAALAGGTR